MTPEISPTPSGRRRVTEAQIRATSGLTGQFASTTPGAVLSAFKKAAPALHISRRLVDLIDHLMGYTIAADWRGAWNPVVWPSNAELAECLGLELSRLKELLRAAIDAGFLIARDHGTRKRFGKRGEAGRIIYAFGFDLSPLAERMPAFQLAAAEHQARREEGRELRREISRLRAAILGLTEFGAGSVVPGQDWPALALETRELAAPARTERDPCRLAPIAAELQRVHAQAEATIAVFCPVENHPTEPENRPHYTTTKQLNIGKPIANEATPADESSGGGKIATRPPAPDQAQSALRGFPMTPAVALQIAPAFRGLVLSARPTWAEVSEAAYVVRSHLGISQHAYGQACQVLGRSETATAIAAISAKHDAGLVRSPGGLLRYMVDAHQAGTLRLDRTLFGLVDGAGGLDRARGGRGSQHGKGRR